MCLGTRKNTPCTQNTWCTTLQRIRWRCIHPPTHTHIPPYAHKLLSSWWWMNSTKICHDHTWPQQCTQKVKVYCLKFNEGLPQAHTIRTQATMFTVLPWIRRRCVTTTIMYTKDSLYRTYPSCHVHCVSINSVDIHHATQPQCAQNVHYIALNSTKIPLTHTICTQNAWFSSRFWS